MKLRHLLPVLLLFLPGLFGCSEETIDFSDVVEKKGLYYKKFTDVPFTGNTSGQIQATYKDGKREGPYFIYREKGQLRKKGTYKDGEIVSMTRFTETGTTEPCG